MKAAIVVGELSKNMKIVLDTVPSPPSILPITEPLQDVV
jgi:hypothetical protein